MTPRDLAYQAVDDLREKVMDMTLHEQESFWEHLEEEVVAAANDVAAMLEYEDDDE